MAMSGQREPGAPRGDGFRSGFVAVAGRPNAGKSTLINQLVGEHVAIVSPIAQTTRRLVRAALTLPGAQVVFVDLPGSQKPVDRLTERMQRAVELSLREVDAVLWLVDASLEPRTGERIVADLVLGSGRPLVIAPNKVDRLSGDAIARRIVQLVELVGDREYAALVPVSAATGDGCDRLVDELVALLPPGPAYFPTDITDMRVEERISEYVREATLHYLRDELPHATAVEVDELDQDEAGALHTQCTIWVESSSQVGIVVGAKGHTIRDVGIDARRVIEHELGVTCHLRLRVKQRSRWRDDEAALERWGL